MRSIRTRMLLSFWLILAIAAATAGLAQAQAISHLDRIGQRAVLRVGTTGDFKPFSFLNPATNEYFDHQQIILSAEGFAFEESSQSAFGCGDHGTECRIQ